MENWHRHVLDTEQAMPPGSSSEKMINSFVSTTTFGTNTVMVFSALFCALICALGLNFIVRCALHCRHRSAQETAEQTAAAALAASNGLKKRALSHIPVAVYGSGLKIMATECPICLGEFLDGERVRVLPKCNHGFHVKCIDRWFMSHSSCPNCRHSLLERLENEDTGTRPPTNRSEQQGSLTVVVDGSC